MAVPPLPINGAGAGAKAPADDFSPLLPSLVAALPGPLLALDHEDRVALASPAAERLFGAAPGTLLGRGLRDLFPEGIDRAPTPALGVGGESLRVEISERRLEQAEGALTLLWLEDATERHRSVENLKQDLRDLEQAARAKSDFVASMSHEIRTPMNAVLGMTDILLESDLDEEQRELALRVRRASANLMTTVNDILDLAKVEAGRLDLETRSFALRPWLRETIELFHAQAARKGLRLDEHVDARAPEIVHGDAPRLRQVLVNLVGNAFKFTPSGSISVGVTFCRRTRDLRFAVRDTGVGIEPDQLDRLFEPWAQAGASVSQEYGGTGLGLAICRRLVERMGGSIEARSTPRVGSEFRFRVPLLPKRSSRREALSLDPAARRPPDRTRRHA